MNEQNLVITLCGSARFERLFKAWNEALTFSGHTVFSLTSYPSDKAGKKTWYTPEQKIELDKAHFRKIEKSDAIFVLNRYGYIGESTLREIEHARSLGKRMYALESWSKGLGIGDSHTDEIKDDMEKDGLLRWSSSPIDTFASYRTGFSCPWSGLLLGPAGSLRRSIVELTHAAERP